LLFAVSTFLETYSDKLLPLPSLRKQSTRP
jgi:hypothetical protein